MDETEKVVETTEEVKAEEVKTEAKKETKKEAKKVDVTAVLNQTKSAVSNGKNFLSKFFGENKSRGRLVLIIMFALQALLAFQSGFVFFLLSVVIAAVGFVGLSAVVPAEPKEDKTEE